MLEYRALRAELIANGEIDVVEHLISRVTDYPDYEYTVIQIKKASFEVGDLIIINLRTGLTANFNVTAVKGLGVVGGNNSTEVIGEILNVENVTGKLKFTHSGNYTGMQIYYENTNLFFKEYYRIVPAYIEGIEEEHEYYLLLEVDENDFRID